MRINNPQTTPWRAFQPGAILKMLSMLSNYNDFCILTGTHSTPRWRVSSVDQFHAKECLCKAGTQAPNLSIKIQVNDPLYDNNSISHVMNEHNVNISIISPKLKTTFSYYFPIVSSKSSGIIIKLLKQYYRTKHLKVVILRD